MREIFAVDVVSLFQIVGATTQLFLANRHITAVIDGAADIALHLGVVIERKIALRPRQQAAEQGGVELPASDIEKTSFHTGTVKLLCDSQSFFEAITHQSGDVDTRK